MDTCINNILYGFVGRVRKSILSLAKRTTHGKPPNAINAASFVLESRRQAFCLGVSTIGIFSLLHLGVFCRLVELSEEQGWCDLFSLFLFCVCGFEKAAAATIFLVLKVPRNSGAVTIV